MINKLFVILFVISFLIIIATIFCFRQPEQAIAQVTTTYSAQSMAMNKSTIPQQYNITAPITNDNNILKIKFLANDISNRINTVASILANTSNLSAVKNIPYANSINKTLHGIPDNLDIAKRKIAQQIILQNGNSSFVSIAFLLSNGDIYMVEPYDRQLKLPINNLAYRDYFIGAIATHKPYLSQVFPTPVDDSNVVTVSVPIYSKENNSNGNASLIGTWNGNINMNSVFQQAINDELTIFPKNKNVSTPKRWGRPGEVFRANHHEGRCPVHLDTLADRGVAGDFVGGDDEGRDLGHPAEPLDRAGDELVVDAAVLDEEQDDRVAGLDTQRSPGAAVARRRRRRRRVPALPRLRLRSPRQRWHLRSRSSPSIQTIRPILPCPAAHRGEHEEADSDQQDAEDRYLNQWVVVEFLPHTFAYLARQIRPRA